MLTIFDNIVTKENDHTELVRSLMDRSPQMAAIVLSRLTEQSISAVDAAKFTYRTQQSFAGPDGRQIPDIVVLGERFQCLIEVKVDPSSATKAQARPMSETAPPDSTPRRT